jgi:hypothetical protein
MRRSVRGAESAVLGLPTLGWTLRQPLKRLICQGGEPLVRLNRMYSNHYAGVTLGVAAKNPTKNNQLVQCLKYPIR